MTEQEYIENRLNDQIKWYDKKSVKSQSKYKILRTIELIASAAIIFLVSLIPENEIFVFVVGLDGVLISVIAGILSLNKFHENWIEYRSVCETLRHEKYMFLTKTGVYNIDDPFALLVERVEATISHENVNWANLNDEDKGENING